MAMSAAVLGSAIANKVCDSRASVEAKAEVTRIWTDIASEIIAHITANAAVTVASGIPVATVGSATAQTGSTTSTGSGTIS